MLYKEVSAHYINNMDQNAFEQTLRLIDTAGLAVAESNYSEQSFGSWYISIHSSPGLRIVWDGRDGWLYVQQKSDQLHPLNSSISIWRDLWFTKESGNQTPKVVVEKLRELQLQIRTPRI